MVCIGRLGRGCLLAAMFSTAFMVVGPAPARAEPDPEPGAVTAKFTDVCGFVKAEFTNVDPAIAAHIGVSRNGKRHLFWPSGFVGAGRSSTLYEVAAKGDVLRFEWQVNGEKTESLEHVHATPAQCDEPDISLSLVDDCGLYFTVVITNTGSAPADVFLDAPTIRRAPIHVPVGKVTVTTPGTAGSTVWVSARRPGGSDREPAEVDAVSRGAECGVPRSEIPTAFFAPGCDDVTVVFIAVSLKGLISVYRNGVRALEDSVDGGMNEWTVAAAAGDVITIGDPPLATYTHARPAGCPAPQTGPDGSAGPNSGPPSRVAGTSRRSLQGPIVQAPPPTGPLDRSSSPARTARPAASATPLVGVALEPEQPMALTALSIGVVLAVLVVGGGLYLLNASRRRRPKWAVGRVWAKASAVAFGRPVVTTTGHLPSMSVRWKPLGDPGIHTLREDVTR